MAMHAKLRSRRFPQGTLAGPFFMLSAALFFTVSNVMIKLLGPEFTVWHIAFYRFFGGLIVLLSVFGRGRNPYAGNNTHALIARGGLGVFTFMAFILAIRLLPLSTALVMVYSFPAFAAVFSFLIYKEHVGIAQIVCIAAAIIGIGVLLDYRSGANLLGMIMALATSASSGLAITLVTELRKKNGPVVIYLYLCTLGTLATLPKFILDPVFPQTTTGWIMIMAIIFFASSGQLLMNQGFIYCRSYEGAVMMTSEAIFAVAVGILILDDPVTWRFFIGGMMVLISSMVLHRLRAVDNKTF